MKWIKHIEILPCQVVKYEIKNRQRTIIKIFKGLKTKKIINNKILIYFNEDGTSFRKEIKLKDTRILVQTGKNGAPDKIVAIFMRCDLDDIVLNFKNKYK